ncbi:MAG: hypothetical protein WA432_03900 [Candidatus Babeliaceae bacterium]
MNVFIKKIIISALFLASNCYGLGSFFNVEEEQQEIFKKCNDLILLIDEFLKTASQQEIQQLAAFLEDPCSSDVLNTQTLQYDPLIELEKTIVAELCLNHATIKSYQQLHDCLKKYLESHMRYS